MTAKRFVRKEYKIWDTLKNKEVYELQYRYEVDDICNILNRIIEENEQLKQDLENLQEQLAHIDGGMFE